ncbi:unnamed protein product [Paramecium pentaurelia]|uniref:Opioid growth factor receptor (OGFr) conserved domain-containing protein n=1 Tax=Paramecium pentaurelia TaxID=43138 RepID=A0A8S1WLP6_9CILI|nr:unnamed protein product [Paramecium pentaurelia]
MRNFDFYNNATWQEVKPKIKAIIEQFQQQSKTKFEDLKSFYQDLEYDHSFIQWMFPNFYASKFNPNSYKLNLEERNRMIKSQTILKRFHQNYILILRFFGIQLRSNQIVIIDLTDDSIKFNYFSQPQTQIIQKQKSIQGTINQKVQSQNVNQKQSENSKIKQTTIDQFIKDKQQILKDDQQFQQQKKIDNQKNIQIQNTNIEYKIDQINENQQQELVLIDKNQFELCCLKNTHNLLRLKRILSSLSVLKHRKEAIQLCQFLKKQLTNLGKEKIYQEYFSGFDRYDEELTKNELKKKKGENRYFNAYKLLYVDEDLVEKVDISLIQ